MKSQANFVKRRGSLRVGVMARLESITYTFLRKPGVVCEPVGEAPAAEPITR